MKFNIFGYKVLVDVTLDSDKRRAVKLLKSVEDPRKIALIKALRAMEPEKYGLNVEGGLRYAKDEVERLFDFTYSPPRIRS